MGKHFFFTLKKIFFICMFLLIVSFIISALAYPSSAGDFPTRPINITVPFGAGGGTDVAARIIAQGVQELLKVAVIITNEPGGATLPALEKFIEREPDGYELIFTSGTTIAATAYEQTPWKLQDDIDQLLMLAAEPEFLVIKTKKSGGKFESLEEMIAYAKQHPYEVTVGTTGPGSAAYFAARAFVTVSGAELQDVPFDGNSAAIVAVAGGHVDACINSLTTARPLVEEGMIQIVACLGSERHPLQPDLPTAQELGFDVVTTGYWGLGVPKGTPEDIKKILHDAFKKAMETQTAIDAAAKVGTTLMYADSEKAKARMTDLYERYSKVIDQ
jgi:tripartite-type tricarboxylate transporter receptor subunit TctC